MLSLKDLKKAVVEKLTASFTDIEVQGRDVKEGFQRPSFFVALDGIKKSAAGPDQIARELSVLIYYFPSDMYEYSLEILEVQEKLEEIFCLKLPVGDRFLNIDETDAVCSDGVLTFSFDIRYEEGTETEDADLMENLIMEE